ncbi:MAG: NUDIX hydrolase [Patescibacteria group bacterium]|nr:NUDIX hydrolase [Patescibacteria group bacterium]
MTENYYDNLPKKRMGAGVLFMDTTHKILLLKPVYKDHWGIPGGVVDSQESPKAACIREIQEEIGLTPTSLQFLSVGYFANRNNNKGESLQFLFYGGVLSAEEIARIRLAKQEIEAYQFVDLATALTMISSDMAKRLPPALASIDTGVPVYLETLD